MLQESQASKNKCKKSPIIKETTRLKNAAELLNNIQLEERDQIIMKLNLQIKQLEETNAELGEKLFENINKQKEKREQSRDIQIQV